jgi:hypothetical protein
MDREIYDYNRFKIRTRLVVLEACVPVTIPRESPPMLVG